ncbi:MAG: enoyl-CoA hydratase-related protein, partial [Gemmatimonadaceae bacterium]
MPFNPTHFRWTLDDRVATITLDRPERKNPLTFEIYAELGRLFRSIGDDADVRAIVLTGAGDD